jgi:nitrogen fixation NifU-like protein
MEDEEFIRDIILEHYRDPRNKKKIEDFDCSCHGVNDRCGDHLKMAIQLEEVLSIQIDPQGCAVSTASASILAELLDGKDRKTLNDWLLKMDEVFEQKRTLNFEEEGEIAAIAHFASKSSRKNCAMLPWRMLEGFLHGKDRIHLR